MAVGRISGVAVRRGSTVSIFSYIFQIIIQHKNVLCQLNGPIAELQSIMVV